MTGDTKRSKAYRLYNSETLCVEESMHVKFDDKELGDETPEQIDIADSEDSDDYSKPNQISEVNDTLEAVTVSEMSEAEAAPDVPTAEAEGEKNHKKGGGGLNCVFGNFFFYVLDNCPQVQSLK